MAENFINMIQNMNTSKNLNKLQVCWTQKRYTPRQTIFKLPNNKDKES